MKCKICFAKFDTTEARDQHLADEHQVGPLAPKPVCPPAMAHVRDLLIDSMLPAWVTDPSKDKKPEDAEHRAKIEAMLREWNAGTVDHLLTVLHKAHWEITPRDFRIDPPGYPD